METAPRQPQVEEETNCTIPTTEDESDPLCRALHRLFGHTNFRANQREIIEEIMRNRDMLIIVPTGGGKSLTYSLSTAMEPGVSILICPIIALVTDQVTRLRASGIDTCFETHELSDAEKQVIYHHFCSPEPGYKIVCTTPETVLSPEMTRTLVILQRNEKLQRFIIDEAHCIDLWGNDFREPYTQLGTL